MFTAIAGVVKASLLVSFLADETAGPLSTLCLEYLKLANDVCVLSTMEAGRLENWDIWPACKQHHHIKRREAQAGAEAGILRYLGGADTKIGIVSMVTANVEVGKEWRPVATSGMMGLRTWGLARRRR